MATEEIHVGDIGTSFEVTIKEGEQIVDISSTNDRKIMFLKPDDTVLEVDAIFKTNGTDGIILYKSVSGDLDQEGRWELQARVSTVSGTWSSSRDCFTVYPNLDD